MDDDLEARLESHAQAFEGLLSLIPAQEYYGRDNSDQWQRKKQTKEEKKAARVAKLDPANRKSAMDVINENERKRKRELGLEETTAETAAPAHSVSKKAKLEPTNAAPAVDDSAAKTKADKRREKRERQRVKIDARKQKLEKKKARKQGQTSEGPAPSADAVVQDEEEAADAVDEDEGASSDEAEVMDFSGLVDDASVASSGSSTPIVGDPALDKSAEPSTTSSATSISTNADEVKPVLANDKTTETTTSDKSKKPKAFSLPKIDPAELQARLKSRIDALRAQRKANGPDGQPARSRQELLEARRKKSESRKAHKKELRQKAKAEEERLNQERLQGSGSPLSADIFSPVATPSAAENNFSFGRVAFQDGGVADASLNEIRELKGKKAPRDPKQALEMAKRKEQRLGGYDEDKRAEIEDKDRWLAMKKKAHGEHVRDDTSLLKKALKRKEKDKARSGKEWQDRQEGVRHGKEMRQKKREDNLAKRKDEKGGKKGGKGKAKVVKKKKGRPGFEGKF